MRIGRWFPTIAAALFVVGVVGAGLVHHRDPRPAFPPVLVPAGARLVRVSDGAVEHCYAHQIATLEDARREAVQAWAAGLVLPCATPAPACDRWTTEARGDPFWARRLGEVDGLDTVTATLHGASLTVDWGDYLCAGPN